MSARMPCSNTAALAIYESQQAAADDRADEAEEYRDAAIAELTDEIISGHKDAVCSLSEALCEGVPPNEVGDAMDCLAVLTKRALYGEHQPRTKEEAQAIDTVRGFVEQYVDTWSDKVEERMYKLAGLE